MKPMANKIRNSASLKADLMHHHTISANILVGMRRPARAPMMMARRRILPKGGVVRKNDNED